MAGARCGERTRSRTIGSSAALYRHEVARLSRSRYYPGSRRDRDWIRGTRPADEIAPEWALLEVQLLRVDVLDGPAWMTRLDYTVDGPYAKWEAQRAHHRGSRRQRAAYRLLAEQLEWYFGMWVDKMRQVCGQSWCPDNNEVAWARGLIKHQLKIGTSANVMTA